MLGQIAFPNPYHAPAGATQGPTCHVTVTPFYVVHHPVAGFVANLFAAGLECQPPFAMKPGTPVSTTGLSLLLI